MQGGGRPKFVPADPEDYSPGTIHIGPVALRPASSNTRFTRMADQGIPLDQDGQQRIPGTYGPGGHLRQTPEEAGAQVLLQDDNMLVVKDNQTGEFQLFQRSDNYAGYTISIGGRDYEYVRSIDPEELLPTSGIKPPGWDKVPELEPTASSNTRFTKMAILDPGNDRRNRRLEEIIRERLDAAVPTPDRGVYEASNRHNHAGPGSNEPGPVRDGAERPEMATRGRRPRTA